MKKSKTPEIKKLTIQGVEVEGTYSYIALAESKSEGTSGYFCEHTQGLVNLIHKVFASSPSERHKRRR
jgi:hypothetical protein